MNLLTKNNLSKILITGLIVMNLAFWISMLVPQKYKTEMKVLFIQRQVESIDVYTASKSAERIATSFSEVIHSTQFLDMVSEKQEINMNYFKDKKEEGFSLKKWEKTVNLDLTKGTGVLEITVLHPDRRQAQAIANQILNIMETNGAQFHGGGEKVKIMSLDNPKTSLKPASPNILLNTFLGLIFGLLGGAIWIYLTPEMRDLKKKFKALNSAPKATTIENPVIITAAATPKEPAVPADKLPTVLHNI